MDARVRTMFDEYAKAFSALDFEKVAVFYADSFIAAGPKGSRAQSKSEFTEWAAKAAEFYKSVGQQGAKLLAFEEIPISDDYALVKIHWGVKFKKTGDKFIEFDISYTIDKTGPEPKIILFISHEDEQEAMQKLGLF